MRLAPSPAALRAACITGLGCALCVAPRAAAAQSCESHRPTEAEGSAGLSYGSAEVASYDSDSGAARIHYALSGTHAPPDVVADQTPAAVLVAAEAADDALATFAELGFLSPRDDGDSPCPDNGGSDALDVYLIHFSAADGQALRDHCLSDGSCASFVLVENDFGGGGYADTEEGLRTVVPHELFHAVQAAYDAGMDPWWSEGSAQWAAKRVYPELADLERFLPAYFDNPWRPLNVPPAGVATSFLYATAIWPVFLDERLGSDLLLDVFSQLDSSSEAVLETTGRVLEARDLSLGAVFLEFAAYNAATGSRAAGDQGYESAAEYPEAELTPFTAEPGASLSEIGAGLGAYYYSVSVSQPIELSLEADVERIAALAIPLGDDGSADLGAVTDLPATLYGDAILVVAGQTLARTDAPFTIRASAPPAAAESGDSGGCAITGRAGPGGWTLSMLCALGLFASRRRRTSKGRGLPCKSAPAS